MNIKYVRAAHMTVIGALLVTLVCDRRYTFAYPWHDLVLVALGVTALMQASLDVIVGSTFFTRSSIDRAKNPAGFRIAISLTICIGVVLAGSAIGNLLGLWRI